VAGAYTHLCALYAYNLNLNTYSALLCARCPRKGDMG
jgi:hypothetical protein